MSDVVELFLQVELPEASTEELDRIGRELRKEILDLDVESVEPVHGESAPENTKALDWNFVGE